MSHITIIDCAIKNSSIHCINRLKEELNKEVKSFRPPIDGTKDLQNDKDSSLYIIFGSATNVEDRLLWQTEIAKFCHERLLNNQPVLGVCFGHQLMADFFGEEIIKNPQSRELKGAREVQISTDMFGLNEQDRFNLFVAHSYQVKLKAKNLKSLAVSEECINDGLYHPTLPYLGFQSHPEASRTFYDRDISNDVILDEKKVKQCLNDGIGLLRKIIQSL